MHVSFEELWRCYHACRRTKRSTFNALAFEVDAEANLLTLQRELAERTYRPGRSICFVTDGPKPREVFAADFRDRVAHHVLVGRQERVFEPRFIADSFACRRGKGTLAASDRLMAMLRQATANGRRPAWALHLDIAGFFASIDKRILYDVIARHVADPAIRWLTQVVLFHDPTSDYIFRALRRRVPPPGAAGYPVPARKSLFGADNRRGLPIGTLTSQFWANVYLNELDQFAKRQLGCRWYLRYVDDVVLLGASRQELLTRQDAIAAFLGRRLRLSLRADTPPPRPVSAGVTFVGWRTWGDRRLARRQTLANLDRRCGDFGRRQVRRAHGGLAQRVQLPAVPVQRLRAALASFAAHLRHGATWRDWRAAWARHAWLEAIFARDAWRLRLRYAPARRPGWAAAYRLLLRRAAPATLLFLPRGRFVEFHGPQRLRAARALGLRHVWLPRAGWALGAGFHRRRTAHCARRALAAGYAVALLERLPHGHLAALAVLLPRPDALCPPPEAG